MINSVAVIGLGSLGAPIAFRIRDLGYELTACDRNPQACDPFSERGVPVAASADECASADLVLVLVATPDQARQVLLGPGGLVDGLITGHRPIVAMVSTVSKDVVRDLAEALREVDVPLLDVPVSGGPARASSGTLTVLTAGDADVMERARPVLAGLGTIFECGAVGDAQVVKLINNVICAANVAITGEALSLALACGLRLEDVLPVLEVSTGRNFMTPGLAESSARLRGWSETRATFDSTLAIVRKDVDLAEKMAAASASGHYPSIEGLSNLLDDLGDDTFDHWQRVADSAPEH